MWYKISHHNIDEKIIFFIKSIIHIKFNTFTWYANFSSYVYNKYHIKIKIVTFIFYCKYKNYNVIFLQKIL